MPSRLLDEGLARRPGDAKMLDLKAKICIEGQLGRCTLEGYVQRATADSGLLRDSTFLQGRARRRSRRGYGNLVFFSRAAVSHFPSSPAFWKAMGQVFALRGMADSSRGGVLQVGGAQPDRHEGRAACVPRPVVDEGHLRYRRGQSLEGRHRAAAHVPGGVRPGLDTAHTYLVRARASADSSERLTAAVVLLTGGSKLAQAATYDPAYIWLDEALHTVPLRSKADTIGPRQQVRVQASFWFGIASVASLQGPYKRMVASKSCGDAKRSTSAWCGPARRWCWVAGCRPAFAGHDAAEPREVRAVVPQVKKQFKCSNF